MTVFVLVLLLAVVYLLSTRCRRGHPELKNLHGWKYAHRGLYGVGCPENSMAAFRKARDMGYGVELDVHLLADGNLAVIHDSQLKRMTGSEGRIEDLTTAQLRSYRLNGTEETIPEFRQVLDLYAGRAPLIVELKVMGNNYAALCERACEMLDMGSFADYAALHFYIGNTDGPFQNNNWQMWRVREADERVHAYADGKWRMMLYDSDHSSGIYTDGTNGGEDHITPVLTGTDYQGYHPALLFNSLIQSEEFQREFILACCDVRNIYFSNKRTGAMMTELTEDYMPYVPDTWRRFGPAWVNWNPENHFKTELKQTSKFFETRNTRFLDIVKKVFDLGNAINITIKVDGDGEVFINGRGVPVASNTRVKYFSSTGMTVTAEPAPGATFKGWTASHSSVAVEDPSAETTRVDFNRVFTLTAHFE